MKLNYAVGFSRETRIAPLVEETLGCLEFRCQPDPLPGSVLKALL
jgi:hypothetical protein